MNLLNKLLIAHVHCPAASIEQVRQVPCVQQVQAVVDSHIQWAPTADTGKCVSQEPGSTASYFVAMVTQG